MSRYIEVEKAMELCNAFYFADETCSVEWLFKNAPSIDIVRCKECSWYKQSEAFCENGNGLWQAGDECFCSYGERRE